MDKKRWIARSLMLLAAVASIAGAYHFFQMMGKYTWLSDLTRTTGVTDEMVAGQWIQYFVIAAGVYLLGYILSFDSKAPSRGLPYVLFGAFGLGVGGGMLLRLVLPMRDLMVAAPVADTAAVQLAIGGGLGLAAIVGAFEIGNRYLWRVVGQWADDRQNENMTLMASRFSLLFSPGEKSMLRSVALADFRTGDRDEAALTLRRLYEEGRRDPDMLEALCQYANEKKQPTLYLEYLQELQKLIPSDAQLLTALFEELAEQGRSADALALYAHSPMPEDDDTRELYAVLLAQAGRDKDAVTVARELGKAEGIPFRRSQKILRDILAANPLCTSACNLLAEQAERMAMREQRQRWLEKSHEADPRQHEVRSGLRQIYRDTNQTIKLLRLLQPLVQENPTDTSTWIELVEALVATAKLKEAREEIAEFEKRHKVSSISAFLRARIEYDQGDLVAAVASAREALTTETRTDRIAAIEAFIRKGERAQLSLDLAERLDRATANPKDLKLQLDVFERLVAGGHSEKAVAFADSVMRDHPTARQGIIDILLHFRTVPDTAFHILTLLADLQVQASQFDEALETIKVMENRSVGKLSALRDLVQRVLKKQPHHLATLRYLGARHMEESQYTEAINYYSLFLAHGGEEDQDVSRTLAKAYLAVGSYPKAKIHALKIKLDDGSPDVDLLRHLIPIAVEAGEPEEAAEYLKQVERADHTHPTIPKLKELVDRGMGTKRFAFLQRELESGKGGAEILEQLGDIARELVNLNDAIQYYQRASREPSIARRAKVKLAWTFAKKKLYDIASETLAEVTVSLKDDPQDVVEVMDLIYEVAEMYFDANLKDRSLKLFKFLMKIDAGYRDVLKRVETLT